ncbi:MAG: alpha/beta hydrolase [Pseudomonadota bacterium]
MSFSHLTRGQGIFMFSTRIHSPWLWIAVPAVLLVFGFLFRRFAEAREAKYSKPPGELLNIRGRRLHVIRRGVGAPTVVLESGGASSSAMWWPIQDRLAAHTTVIAYDRAGLGWSDAAPLPRTIKGSVDDLGMLLQKFNASPPYVLVGLSYGGPVIRAYAARHPHQIAGMVFIDIPHEVVFTTPGAQTYLRRASFVLRVVGRLAQISFLRLLRVRGLADSSTALPYTAEQREALSSRFPTAVSFFTGASEFAAMLQIGDEMKGLGKPGLLGSTPVAVISHGNPYPGPFAVLETNHLQGQQELAALSNNSVLIVAKNSSHAIPLEEPEVVLDAINRVVESARNGIPLNPM